MICYYLNVHFQGQRVKDGSCYWLNMKSAQLVSFSVYDVHKIHIKWRDDIWLWFLTPEDGSDRLPETSVRN